MGLSPRVRGSLPMDLSIHLMPRSIPTCAGQPSRRARQPDCLEVYPHVCGAAPAALVNATCSKGLSPRVRGSQRMGLDPLAKQRSIPTCAGQPRCAGDWNDSQRVYPHVCGAAVSQLRVIAREQGLSPRVRGSLNHIVLVPIHKRSIPTCAGQP